MIRQLAGTVLAGVAVAVGLVVVVGGVLMVLFAAGWLAP